MDTSIEFNIKKTVQYWLDGAEYDLSTAIAMLEKEKYPYSLFMGHLALEKLLKALVVKTSGTRTIYSFSSVIGRKNQIKNTDKDDKSTSSIYGISFRSSLSG